MSLRSRVKTASSAILGAPDEMSVAIATDILQTRILHHLFVNMTRDQLLVKGGKAMQLQPEINSHRLTQDIDLAADPQVNMLTLNSRMHSAIKNALSSGLLTEINVREQGVMGTNCVSPKWHITGKLAGSNSPVHIKIEVSKRDQLPEDCISRFDYEPDEKTGVGEFVARTYSPMAIAGSKTAALLHDKRYQPRDLYDLALLIETKVEPPVALLAALGKERLNQMANYVWQKVAALSYADFTANVKPHLSKQEADGITEHDWENMQINVAKTLEEWIASAIQIADKEIPRSQLRERMGEIRNRRAARKP